MAATLCGPGGVRAVIVENLLLKQQLIVLRRPRQRAPRLTASDRCSDSGHSSSAQDESERSPSAYAPRRFWHFIRRWCVARTADCSHPSESRSSPDRKGRARHSSRPSSSSRRGILGSAVHGLRASSRERSGSTSTKNVVYRVLSRHYCPTPGGTGPSWLSCHRPHDRQSVECGPLSMRVHRAPERLGARGHGPIHAPPRRSRRASRSGQWRRPLPHV